MCGEQIQYQGNGYDIPLASVGCIEISGETIVYDYERFLFDESLYEGIHITFID